jgi:hypothetical protein
MYSFFLFLNNKGEKHGAIGWGSLHGDFSFDEGYFNTLIHCSFEGLSVLGITSFIRSYFKLGILFFFKNYALFLW